MKPGKYFWSIRLYLDPANGGPELTSDGTIEIDPSIGQSWRAVRQELFHIIDQHHPGLVTERARLHVLAFSPLS